MRLAASSKRSSSARVVSETGWLGKTVASVGGGVAATLVAETAEGEIASLVAGCRAATANVVVLMASVLLMAGKAGGWGANWVAWA